MKPITALPAITPPARLRRLAQREAPFSGRGQGVLVRRAEPARWGEFVRVVPVWDASTNGAAKGRACARSSLAAYRQASARLSAPRPGQIFNRLA